MFYKKLTLLALSFLTISANVNAHGVWVSDRRGDTQIVVGEAAEDTSYKASSLTSIQAFDQNYHAKKVDVIDMKNHVNLKYDKDNTALFSINFDYGYWSNAADGTWVNKPMDKVPGSTIGTHAVKFAVIYLKDEIKPKFIKGLDLQLIPKVNPLTLVKGDDLTLQLLYKGKPMPHTEVIADVVNDVNNTIKTDDDGFVTVKVANNALNVIGVETTIPFEEKTPKGTRAKYFTTVSFTLQP